MLKIRRPLGRLIFNMGIAIPGKTVFLIGTAPCMQPFELNDKVMQSIVKRYFIFRYFKPTSTDNNICLYQKGGVLAWIAGIHYGDMDLTICNHALLAIYSQFQNLEASRLSEVGKRGHQIGSSNVRIKATQTLLSIIEIKCIWSPATGHGS